MSTGVVAPMSSNIKYQPPYRIVVPIAEIIKDSSCTTRLVPSAVKADQVRVIDESRLAPRIGQLSQTATLSVLLGIAYVFDIRD